jgi:hypothetical protein
MKKIKVFISYAWESLEYKTRVWELAEWLLEHGKNRLEIVIDQEYENKAPREGWPVWMATQVKVCDIVLILCTPKYLSRFEKNEEPGVGLGVTFEGANITQELYNAQMQNEKFCPIVPDDGDRKYIPTILRAYDNSHTFPSGNERILKMIFDDNPKLGSKNISQISVDASKEKVAEEIVTIIIANVGAKKPSMKQAIGEMVRNYFELSDPQKKAAVTSVGIYESNFDSLVPLERDKKIFEIVHEKQLLAELWTAIAKINNKEAETNPFK